MSKQSKISWLIPLVVLIAVGAFFYFRGHSFESIGNFRETFDLTLSAGEVNEGVFKSNVLVTLTNSSARSHANVKFKVTAYDRNKNVVTIRELMFARPIGPNGYLERVVFVPKSTTSVKSQLLDSAPY